jgi:hypothetical protein
MINATAIAWNFERNAIYYRQHLDGLTHSDSLVQPPVEGNCINWIMGHVMCYRNYSLQALGQPAVIDGAALARYERGSAPITGDGPGVLKLEQLVGAYWMSQEVILKTAPTLTAAAAAEVIQAAGFELPRAEILVSFMRHESYHAGQLEWLRPYVIAAR